MPITEERLRTLDCDCGHKLGQHEEPFETEKGATRSKACTGKKFLVVGACECKGFQLLVTDC